MNKTKQKVIDKLSNQITINSLFNDGFKNIKGWQGVS